MNQFFGKMITNASTLIYSAEYKERNILKKTAFTRNRKLTFPIIISLILNMLSRTTQIEIDDYFDKVLCKQTESVTSQAFFKARKNVSSNAFKELFFMSRKMSFDENKIKRYKGYRVFAIDGSELRLNKTRENSDVFSTRNNAAENKFNARISLLHDVVSNFVIDAQIGSIDTDERTYAMRNLEYFSEVCNEKDIVIFDRGYPSAKMISFMSDMNCKYLMRLQKSTFKAVTENPGNDFWITVNCGEKAYPARVIRVILNTGEVETLITNLSENEFITNDFKDLYFKRWGIETAYDTLKNKLLIEKFSGRTTLAILQEFFAMIFMLNCIAAMSLAVDRKISAYKKHCKYKYRANRNLMIGYFKHRISTIILFPEKAISITKLLNILCLNQPVPVIPGRSAPRPLSSHQRKVFTPKHSI